MGKIKVNLSFLASTLSNASVSYGGSDYLTGVYTYPNRVCSLVVILGHMKYVLESVMFNCFGKCIVLLIMQ